MLARIGNTPLSEVPSLAAWRRAFRAFGVDPTAYRSAAEALLRRLTKQGSIPSINTLVDIGNLVASATACRSRCSTSAGHRRHDGPVRTGTSVHGPRLGRARDTRPGEVIFIDDAGLVSARRWCWRQSAESASGPDDDEVLVTVEGAPRRRRGGRHGRLG